MRTAAAAREGAQTPKRVFPPPRWRAPWTGTASAPDAFSVRAGAP